LRLVIDGHRLTAQRTGVGRCLEGLLTDWADTGWPLGETVLVGRDPDGLRDVPESSGLRTVVVGRNWPGLVWENFGLGGLLRPGDLLFAPANVVPWRWRGPSVVILYDTLLWSAPAGFSRMTRLRFGARYRTAARRATRVIVPSAATARDVARFLGVADGRTAVVYPGPEPAFRPLDPTDPIVVAARSAVGLAGEPFFLFVGKRSRRRHLPAILEGFEWHRRRFPDHRLVFVGPGGVEGLPGAESGVVAAGHVAEPVLHGLYASALALLYPSDHEGFGLPVVEAMASGCPVVTLRNSALVESGGEAAYYLDAAEPGPMADALSRLSGDAHGRADLVARGLVQAARFTRAGFADGVRREIRAVAEAIRHGR